MTWPPPLQTIASLASLTLGLTGAALGLGPDKRLKKYVITLLFCALVVAGAASLYELRGREQDISRSCTIVLDAVGDEKRTFEDLVGSLPHPSSDPFLLQTALARLIRDEKVGTEILTVRDDFGTRFKARVYFRLR